jgi:hypothetical protein
MAPAADYLTVGEVAAECRASRNTVRNWYGRGLWVAGRRVRLAAERVGGRKLIRRESLAAFLAALNPGAAPPPEGPAAAERRAIEAQRRLAERLA